MTIIDIHAHTFSLRAQALVEGRYDPGTDPYQRDLSPESRATNAANREAYGPKLRDPAIRRAHMARMGVDIQVIAPAPAQQHYWADDELLLALSRAQNDDIAALVAADTAHCVGLGTLPMRNPSLAVDEAARAVETLGLRGFQIDTRVNTMELSDPALDPLWERIARLDVPLFVHPLGFSHGRRFAPFFMVNSVGQPLEETIAIAHLIHGGVLDRHPDLKVVIAHGGGYFPFYVGRMDHAWTVRPEVRRLTAQPPSAYLKRLWFDTCVFRADHIDTLVALCGADRVMLGSDYPFDMGDDDPVGLVARCRSIDDAGRRKILGETARGLFKVPPRRRSHRR